ncbi:Hypothetical protein TPAR_09709 [Tolypocladium paradoxum]|uniref:Uncharacterized protein n=1 Tax=Tolypocladium paradoxum TaxID=94208 RepID=A0A2S4KL43_9HYPO|nr:Hypothetical protein TPAR_09709 [Tolypocladium paradoxum]
MGDVLDPLKREMSCPSCGAVLQIPWKTYGLPRDYDGDRRRGLAGEGYGDGQLSHTCKECRFEVTHDALRLHNFRRHAQALISNDIMALPGTILGLGTGLPKLASTDADDRLFGGLLVKKGTLTTL